MKKFLKCALAAALLFALCPATWAAERPVMTREQYKKNLAYNKNFLPAGWQYEAGYNLWRMSRKQPANRYTYRQYKNDRVWHGNMRQNHRPEQILLDTYDWTVEELALLMRQYEHHLKFHPAGYED